MIINPTARIGDFARIYQNVTIGANVSGHSKTPTIGNNCVIYEGSRIVGEVTIGDNCAIGANSFVNKDFGGICNVTIAGAPARIVSNKGNQSYNAVERLSSLR